MRLLNKSHKLQSEIEAQERAKKRTFYQEEIATFHTQSYHSPPKLQIIANYLVRLAKVS
jgi:hypothetical protein